MQLCCFLFDVLLRDVDPVLRHVEGRLGGTFLCLLVAWVLVSIDLVVVHNLEVQVHVLREPNIANHLSVHQVAAHRGRNVFDVANLAHLANKHNPKPV